MTTRSSPLAWPPASPVIGGERGDVAEIAYVADEFLRLLLGRGDERDDMARPPVADDAGDDADARVEAGGDVAELRRTLGALAGRGVALGEDEATAAVNHLQASTAPDLRVVAQAVRRAVTGHHPARSRPLVEREVLGVDEVVAVEASQAVREPEPCGPAVVGGHRGTRVGERLLPGRERYLGQVVEEDLLPGAERLARRVDGGEEGGAVAGEDGVRPAPEQGVDRGAAGRRERPGHRLRGRRRARAIVQRGVAGRDDEVGHDGQRGEQGQGARPRVPLRPACARS